MGGERTKGRKYNHVLQDQKEYPPLSCRGSQHDSVKEASPFFSRGPATVFESDIICQVRLSVAAWAELSWDQPSFLTAPARAGKGSSSLPRETLGTRWNFGPRPRTHDTSQRCQQPLLSLSENYNSQQTLRHLQPACRLHIPGGFVLHVLCRSAVSLLVPSILLTL